MLVCFIKVIARHASRYGRAAKSMALALAYASAVLPAHAEPPAAAPAATNADVGAKAGAGTTAFTDEQKKAIGVIVKDYLLANPEVMIEVQTALEAKLEKEQSEKLRAFMAENAKAIYRDPQSPVAGDVNGDITVVEFFDYNCGYCKRGLTEVKKLIDGDKRVRFVFKELPILSKGSEEAAKAALAAKRQGKYWEFHQAMLSTKGQANEASALKIAQDLGLDIAKYKADIAGADVQAELDDDKALAKKMGINGTPHFLVGDRSIPGAPEDLHDQLQALVGDFRKADCKTC